MSDLLKVGKKVEVYGKGVRGVIVYTGKTQFAPGYWIGLILDEPKGRNNGTVHGVEYFKVDFNIYLNPNLKTFVLVRRKIWNVY